MLELKKSQRAMLVDKLPGVANVAVGALLFGQFFGERAFSPLLALLGLGLGLGLWGLLIGWAVLLAGGDES